MQTTHVAVDSTHTSESPEFYVGISQLKYIFCDKIEATFEEAIHWRRNIFQVPSGSTGKAFVAELAQLFQAYADNSSLLESIALKATTTMPTLLLQKPHPSKVMQGSYQTPTKKVRFVARWGSTGLNR